MQLEAVDAQYDAVKRFEYVLKGDDVEVWLIGSRYRVGDLENNDDIENKNESDGENNNGNEHVVDNLPDGTFSISDWNGYPDNLPRPEGPFRLLVADEYESARKLADKTNAKLHRDFPEVYSGKDIHEIHPVKFGGSATDLSNKVALTRSEHAKFTTWWNRMQRSIKKI